MGSVAATYVALAGSWHELCVCWQTVWPSGSVAVTCVTLATQEMSAPELLDNKIVNSVTNLLIISTNVGY